MGHDRIFLDHAASTPLAGCARDAVVAALETPGNPSSAHAEGRLAKGLLEDARGRVADVLGCRPREIVFTGSGTAAAQLGLRGAARARRAASSRIVISGVEHPCVHEAADDLVHEGFEVVRVAPATDGHVDADSFLDAVGDDAAIAALVLANHETGVVNPVSTVAAALRAQGIPLLCDACLGPGRLPVGIADVGADLVVFSGHKAGGPRGIGALYVRRRTRVLPLSNGGLQEERLVPGTENVAGAAGFAASLEFAIRHTAERAKRYEALLALLFAGLGDVQPWSRVGEGARTVPGMATLELPGVEGEAAMINLDLEGVAVSTGSACALGASTPGPSLQAMGWSPERVARTLRISIGEGNDETQMTRAGDVLSDIVRRLRSLARRESNPRPSP